MNLPNKPKVLAATYNPVSNTKMISFLVDFPTVLLAELRTHRILTQGSLYEHMELDDFNMSANSARAIPAKTYLKKILDNPFVPIWTKQQKGMSGDLLERSNSLNSTQLWNNILEHFENNDIKETYEDLLKEGVHKQNANRLLAPFAYTTCILSGTEWDNFFELRCPKYQSDCKIFKSRKEALKSISTSSLQLVEELGEQHWQNINHSSAQPEFQVIAEMLYDLYQEAKWKENKYHIPFLDFIQSNWFDREISLHTQNEEECYYDVAMKISASMCAKLSYNTQDNEDTLEKHLERANMLIEHKHSEPFSHQAIAMDEWEYKTFAKRMIVDRSKLKDEHLDLGSFTTGRTVVEEFGKCYNLTGFISQRYILENY